MLGANEQTLTIPVKPIQKESESTSEDLAFDGVDLDIQSPQTGNTRKQDVHFNAKFQKEEKVEKLKVAKMKVKPFGELTIYFSRPI